MVTVQTADKSNDRSKEREDESPNNVNHNVSISVSQGNGIYRKSNGKIGLPQQEVSQSMRGLDNMKNNNSDLGQ